MLFGLGFHDGWFLWYIYIVTYLGKVVNTSCDSLSTGSEAPLVDHCVNGAVTGVITNDLPVTTAVTFDVDAGEVAVAPVNVESIDVGAIDGANFYASEVTALIVGFSRCFRSSTDESGSSKSSDCGSFDEVHLVWLFGFLWYIYIVNQVWKLVNPDLQFVIKLRSE